MDQTKKIALFNSPLEVALRLIFILNGSSRPLDVDRLVNYNYLLVHSSDIPDSPKSIHADLPRRSSEMPVNEVMVKKALSLLIAKGLVSINYSKTGFEYKKNPNTALFADYFGSSYSKQLRERTEWLCSKFDKSDDKELADIMKQYTGKWGNELRLQMNVEG